MKLVLKYAKITSFVLGALSCLGFAPYHWWPIAFIAFSGWLGLLIKASSKRQAFVWGYSFGFAHFAFGFSWIGNALLIDPERFGWLYPITLIASGAFFGLFLAGPAVLTMMAQKAWQKWLLLGVGVVISEWLRSFVLTGFPWNLLGYTLAFSDELIQAAALGGTYLLSLAAVLTYSVFGLCVENRNNWKLATAWVVVVVVILWGGGYWRLNKAQTESGKTVVRIVQPSIPQTMKWSRDALEKNFDAYVHLSSLKTGMKPDLIVWGETASPFMLDVDEEHLQKLLPALPEKGYLATGMISYQPVKGRYLPHNSMVVIDKKGVIWDYYHKSHLVPFGEYIPLRDYLPSFIRPVANAIGTFGHGDGPKLIKLDGLPSLGAIICYEVIFPHQIINPEQKPDFLVNLTNDGWYGNSAGPYQHWVATKMRAVEEGITIVRAANNGISGVITQYGREKAVLSLNYRAVLDVKLDARTTIPTLYNRFGNGVILTFCLILLFLGIIKIEKPLLR